MKSSECKFHEAHKDSVNWQYICNIVAEYIDLKR